MFTPTDLDDLKYLPDVYVRLFHAIERKRPSMTDAFAQTLELTTTWNAEVLDKLCSDGCAIIRGVFATADHWLERLAHDRPALTQRTFVLANLFTHIYTQANYWHVLLDGVLFEGVFERDGEALLASVASSAEIDILDLLQNVLDPLTEYRYVPATEAETQAARSALQQIQDKLALAGRRDVAATLARFVPFYSSVKRWQVVFKDLSKQSFQRVIPPLRAELLSAARELGVEVPDPAPWALLTFIDERLLPAVFTAVTGDLERGHSL
jgi:hypothetical protein